MGIRSSMSRLFSDAGSNKEPTGTGYTNLNRFLGANAGNQLGAKVSGNLQNQIGTVQNQLQDEKTTFEKEAEKNRLNTTANATERDSIIGRFASPSTAGGELGADDVAKVGQFRAGQYAGPTGLQDTSALSQQAQDLASQTGNLSSSGTQELLRRTIGGGRYTQGQQRLDSILMDRSGLKQVGREAQALGSDVNRANLAAQGQAQALAGQAAQFGQQTQDQLKGALGGLDTAAQAQLATAQSAENDRLARVQAIQDFAAGKVAQKDASGNVIKDAYGNIQYSTTNARGATDGAGQLDYLKNLLTSQGANQTEIDSLLGAGNFAQGQSQYNQSLSDLQNRQRADAIIQSIGTTGEGALTAGYRGTALEPYYTDQVNPYSGDSSGSVLNTQKLREDILSGKIDPNSIYGNIDRGDGGGNPVAMSSLGQLGNQVSYTLDGTYNPLKQAAAQDFYGTRGLAGQALQGGKTEDLYTNLSRAVANSQAAQNLNLQGVASQPIRNNYTALQQLLGQTADLNKFSGDPTYQAGNLLLNPDQIRRSLGY